MLSDVKLLAVNEISNWLKLIEAHWCKRHVACNMASKSSFSLADRAPAMCLQGHGFVSCLGLRIIFVPCL